VLQGVRIPIACLDRSRQKPVRQVSFPELRGLPRQVEAEFLLRTLGRFGGAENLDSGGRMAFQVGLQRAHRSRHGGEPVAARPQESGGIGVSVLSVTQNPDGTLTFHNQHSWVTVSGDTIETKPAAATAFPTGIQGLYAVSYTNGVVITGGTGRFANAAGKIHGWGAANLATNEIVLRYEGKVCVANPA